MINRSTEFIKQNQKEGVKVLAAAKKIQNLDSVDYLMAYKSGYLNKKSKTAFKGWSIRFCVLTNVGLVYMDKPGQKIVRIFSFLDF